MPRLTRLRIGALEDLAKQVRFASPASLRRQITAAQTLAQEIDPERNYPMAWVASRLTGFRPDAADETVVVGAALRADLSALVEGLSARARLSPAELGKDALTLAALCARWGVDRKTIERKRRDGLIGVRVVGADGRRRLMFTRDAVERFERASRVAPPRPPPPTRDIRGERPPAHPAPRSAAALARRRRAEFARRALERGIPAAAIAARLGRSRASAHRMANERRAALLAELDLVCPVSPMFARADAHESLLAPLCVRRASCPPLPIDAAQVLALYAAAEAPDERDERARAAAMCFLRWRAANRMASLPRFNPPAPALDDIETDLRWAARICADACLSQSRLAAKSIEERIGAALSSLPPDALAHAHAALMRSISAAAWALDPFAQAPARRLSGAATPEIARTLSALAERGVLPPPKRAPSSPSTDGHDTPRRAASRARSPSSHPIDWTRELAPWRWLLPPAPVRQRAQSLPEPARSLLARRYGWLADSPPAPFNACALALRLTPRAAAALERDALRAARALPALPVLNPERNPTPG